MGELAGFYTYSKANHGSATICQHILKLIKDHGFIERNSSIKQIIGINEGRNRMQTCGEQLKRLM